MYSDDDAGSDLIVRDFTFMDFYLKLMTYVSQYCMFVNDEFMTSVEKIYYKLRKNITNRVLRNRQLCCTEMSCDTGIFVVDYKVVR